MAHRPHHNRRKHSRKRLAGQSRLIIESLGPLRQPPEEAVVEDLSRGGIRFTARRFAEKGSACSLVLPLGRGRYYRLRGRVVRCACIGYQSYQLAVRFDEPFNVAELPGDQPGGAEKSA